MSQTVRSESIDGGFATGVFDGSLNNMPGIDMYRAWVFPDLYPAERQPVLKNWDKDDLGAFCGIYGPDESWPPKGPRRNGDIYPYDEGPFADPSN